MAGGMVVADSNITKRALAAALRELMDEEPFEKIQVAHICERCDMSRKSFYYHFKDKYDLVNWIFDTDIIPVVRRAIVSEQHVIWRQLVAESCEYFYENRQFYRKALKIKGQNSLIDHFRDFIQPILKLRLSELVGDLADDAFTVDFFTDAVVCSLVRWMLADVCEPADAFVEKLFTLIHRSACAVCQEFEDEQK